MSLNRILIVAAMLIALVQGLSQAAPAPADELDNVVLLDLKDGRVTILLRPDLAPKHVEQVKQLARDGFYEGLAFDFVIPGFMTQTGFKTAAPGDGVIPQPDLPDELSKVPFVRGSVGAVRSEDGFSGNYRFFICFEAAPSLNGKYTLWGEVIDGIDAVDKIKKGDKIIKMQLASDADTAAKKFATTHNHSESMWHLPVCENIKGTGAVTFTRDDGKTLAPTTEVLRPVTYTMGLVALDTPNTLLATVNETLIRSTDWLPLGHNWCPQF